MAFSNKSNLFTGSLLSVFARDGFFKCWTWTPVTCIFFDCKFLKKFLFGIAYKAREDTILNYKNDKSYTFFSFYKNIEMKDACKTIEIQSETFSYLVILPRCSFLDAGVVCRGYSKCKNIWFSYTFGFTLRVYRV